MVQAQDQRVSAMIDRIAATLPDPAGRLARPLYGALGPADLAAIAEPVLVAGVQSLWHFMAERQPGMLRMRIHRPDWAEGGVVAEIVNDDMPFLVDSTVAVFNRHGLSIELLAHPILTIRRDESGRLTGLEDGSRESVMSIHLSGCRDTALLSEVERDLAKVLADVRVAVTDWRAMLHRLSLATAELDDPALAASGIAPMDIAETKAFLRWLADNHFTLLGYREYRYEDTPDGKVMRVLDDSNLGIMRDPTLAVLHGHRNLATLPPDIRAFLEAPQLLFVAKANQRSPVHRPVHMDIIGVKRLDETGQVVAERRFIGLFTSGAYSELPAQIPILRQKVASVMQEAGFAPASHDGKALAQILDSYPRDELFTIPTGELFDIALGVLRLQDRRRIALFLRRDPFERFVSCLIYVPRDRYDAALRDRFNALLAEAFCGGIAASYIHLSEAPLARLHVIVKTSPGQIPAVDIPALESRLIAAGRNWADDLMQALTSLPQGGALARRYAGAFDAAYCDHHSPEQAVADLLRIEGLVGTMPACRLDGRPGAAPEAVTFRLYRREEPVPLSDVLPILEHHGLRVLTENPYRIRPADQDVVWLHDFEAVSIDGTAIDADAVRTRFEAGFLAGWSGATEEDGFNRLILSAGLDWRETTILRSYAQYLRQIGFTYSRRYIEATLAKYPAIAARLVALFHARLDPAGTGDAAALETTLRRELDAVAVADEDRILRRYLDLILASLRTNYYQRQPDGQPKPYLAIKLDSAHLDGLPKPRPHVEIWVSSPDVEAVHLRGGKVARGGIRWSDRREDFRTEILGLIKAQMVKNAVIVPVGSKGGFVVKRPPPAEAGRPALMTQVIACYRTLMSGLLDLTDNRQGDRIVPPADVRCLDGDDPYLVVAADKGTATFSDIANGIAQDYGFWLDDAFASGGSAGYDHKALGITAAGAWVAVERHLREIGVDLHRQGLTMVGVGDMSGDVFGNGLLHSDQVRLVAAFDHRHIFLDPDPDPARSFAERRRLFALAGSSWADYDPTLLSPGGMVLPRSAKSVTISAQAMAVLGLDNATLTPADLMQAILKAPVDLLWFGGIGTYIKAASETHAQIGDRANDAIRIDGRDVRAKVVGEGANLGVTQRGRIEYALRGGRINTDAVDNSAGVDCSDHEVNIKILTADLIGRGQMDRAARDKLLASMATEVSRLVLRDNDRQTFTLSMAERDGPLMVDAAPRLIQRFARTAGLDRALEALPEDGELASRNALVRPELAVLLAFAKMDLYNALLASSLPDDPALEDDLIAYFPTPLQRDHADAIRRHGLRREITATQITNTIIDRGGIDFVAGLVEDTGASPAVIAAGFCAARDLFGLPALWAALDAMDQVDQAATQIDLARATAQALRQAVAWLIRIAPHTGQEATLSVAALADPWRNGMIALRADSAPADAAGRLAELQAGVRMLDVLPLAAEAGVPVERAALLWSDLGERCQFDKLAMLAQMTPQPDGWSRRALAGLLMDLAGHRRRIAARILARGDTVGWQNAETQLLARWDTILAGLLTGPIDLARLTIAEHALRSQIV